MANKRAKPTSIYGRCGACGDQYDVEMLRPIGRGLVCYLCLNLAKERFKRDAHASLRKRLKDENIGHREGEPCGAGSPE